MQDLQFLVTCILKQARQCMLINNVTMLISGHNSCLFSMGHQKWFSACMACSSQWTQLQKSTTSCFVQLILVKDMFFPEVKTQLPVSVRAKQFSKKITQTLSSGQKQFLSYVSSDCLLPSFTSSPSIFLSLLLFSKSKLLFFVFLEASSVWC